MKYIAKPGEENWYIPYSLVVLEDDYRGSTIPWDSGLFRGWRKCKNESECIRDRKIGDIYYDGELCPFDEFWELTEEEYVAFCDEHRLDHSKEPIVDGS